MHHCRPLCAAIWTDALIRLNPHMDTRAVARTLQPEMLYPCLRQLHQCRHSAAANTLRMHYVMKLARDKRAESFPPMIAAACDAGRPVEDGIPILTEMRLMGLRVDPRSYVSLFTAMARHGSWEACVNVYSDAMHDTEKFSVEVCSAFCDAMHRSSKWGILRELLFKLEVEGFDAELGNDGLKKILETSTPESEWQHALSVTVPWVVQRLPKAPSHALVHALLTTARRLRDKVSPDWLERNSAVKDRLPSLSPENLDVLIQCYPNQWTRAVQVFQDSTLKNSEKSPAIYSLVRVLSAAQQWTVALKLPFLTGTMHLVDCLVQSKQWDRAVSALQNVSVIDESDADIVYRLIDGLCDARRLPAAMQVVRNIPNKFIHAQQLNRLLECCHRSSLTQEIVRLAKNFLHSDATIDVVTITLFVDICYRDGLTSDFLDISEKILEKFHTVEAFGTKTIWKMLILVLQSGSARQANILVQSLTGFVVSQRFISEMQSTGEQRTLPPYRWMGFSDRRLLENFIRSEHRKHSLDRKYGQACEEYLFGPRKPIGKKSSV